MQKWRAWEYLPTGTSSFALPNSPLLSPRITLCWPWLGQKAWEPNRRSLLLSNSRVLPTHQEIATLPKKRGPLPNALLTTSNAVTVLSCRGLRRAPWDLRRCRKHIFASPTHQPPVETRSGSIRWAKSVPTTCIYPQTHSLAQIQALKELAFAQSPLHANSVRFITAKRAGRYDIHQRWKVTQLYLWSKATCQNHLISTVTRKNPSRLKIYIYIYTASPHCYN